MCFILSYTHQILSTHFKHTFRSFCLLEFHVQLVYKGLDTRRLKYGKGVYFDTKETNFKHHERIDLPQPNI